MKIFTDALKREWEISVTVAGVRRVAALADVDLLSLATGELALELAADPLRVADLLWPVVKPQADAKGVSLESFCEGLAGEALERASACLLAEVVDFFPNPALRAELGSRMETALQAIRKRSDDAIANLAKPETKTRIKKETLEALKLAEAEVVSRSARLNAPPNAPASSE